MRLAAAAAGEVQRPLFENRDEFVSILGINKNVSDN